jgi:arylsulfatase A-like enzyme/Tfp pilus assembly protein PilF
VTVDTCRADRIGCYGAAAAATPTIDGLAARGLRFSHAQAAAPMTLPSHASILTGLYPDRHGLRDNGTGPLAAEAVTLAEVLAGAGWDTAAFLSAVPLDSTYGAGQGFARYDDDFTDGAAGGDPLTRLHTDQRTADQVVDAALPWIRAAARGDRRFLAWVHFFDPHSPYAPPPDSPRAAGADAYDGEIAFVDREIARLLGELGRAGERTVVCVTADHGESLGEHGEATHGFLLYRGAVRVPWVLAGPGVPRGVTVEEPVSVVQVMPTLLELAGVDAPPGLDGESALEPAARGTAFAEALFPRLNFGWSASRSIRDGRWKYIESSRPELYDLAADLHEAADVLAAHPDVAEKLRENLHRHYARGGALAAPGTGPDEDARARLEGLGYVGVGGAAAVPDDDLWDFAGGDPRDMVGVFDDLQPLPTLVMSGRREEARALVASLLERSPGNAAILRRVAQLWSRARNGPEALDAYTRLLEAEPGDASAQAAVGTLLASEGRCEEAAVALDRAESLGFPDAAAAADVAAAWTDCGRPDRALVAWDAALAADPGSARAAQGKALALRHAGRAREAAQVLRDALARAPDDVDLLNNLAWLLANESLDPAEGLRLAKRAAERAPDDASVLDTLGWAAVRAGAPAEGRAALERAWEATRDPEVRAHLGVALAELGEREEGRAHVRAALAERPALGRVPEVAKWR